MSWRGVESGGATREIGHYVAFCGPAGEPLAWLQPIQSLTANGSHAVVIAPSLVSVEVFRAQQTYELLIARHEPRGGEDGRRPQLSSQVLFRGTQGYLSLSCGARTVRRGQDHAGVLQPFRRAEGDPASIHGGGQGSGPRGDHNRLPPGGPRCGTRFTSRSSFRGKHESRHEECALRGTQCNPSFYVGLAWRKLFGPPWDPRLWFAFVLHDAGYFSKPNLEGEEGERHVELARAS